jgi:hypothetical protein
VADRGASGDSAVRVPLDLAARQAGRDVRTIQRWAQQGRISVWDNGTGRVVDLPEVLRVEADLRERVKNRQMQRLAALLGPADK